MKILKIGLMVIGAIYFSVCLIGYGNKQPIVQLKPLTSEEIESTIQRCIKKKLLTHIVTSNYEIVQIYCQPESKKVKR